MLLFASQAMILPTIEQELGISRNWNFYVHRLDKYGVIYVGRTQFEHYFQYMKRFPDDDGDIIEDYSNEGIKLLTVFKNCSIHEIDLIVMSLTRMIFIRRDDRYKVRGGSFSTPTLSESQEWLISSMNLGASIADFSYIFDSNWTKMYGIYLLELERGKYSICALDRHADIQESMKRSIRGKRQSHENDWMTKFSVKSIKAASIGSLASAITFTFAAMMKYGLDNVRCSTAPFNGNDSFPDTDINMTKLVKGAIDAFKCNCCHSFLHDDVDKCPFIDQEEHVDINADADMSRMHQPFKQKSKTVEIREELDLVNLWPSFRISRPTFPTVLDTNESPSDYLDCIPVLESSCKSAKFERLLRHGECIRFQRTLKAFREMIKRKIFERDVPMITPSDIDEQPQKDIENEQPQEVYTLNPYAAPFNPTPKVVAKVKSYKVQTHAIKQQIHTESRTEDTIVFQQQPSMQPFRNNWMMMPLVIQQVTNNGYPVVSNQFMFSMPHFSEWLQQIRSLQPGLLSLPFGNNQVANFK